MNTIQNPQLAQLREMIDSCRRAVVFTGAGISTESGIPDFRSPGGYWTKNRPIDFSEFISSHEARVESWRRKLVFEQQFKTCEPNRGHRAVAELYRRGKVVSVITQNIDNLHQRSGIAPEHVIELHGNGTYAVCLSCGKRYEMEPLLDYFRVHEDPPVCECEGLIKSATISFGQAMPVREMERAEEETLKCDFFLVLGSSLVVFPAAGFPLMAKRNGARLVIINRDPTDMDGIADLVLNMEIGPVMGEVMGVA